MDKPIGSGPGYRRPVLILQADEFNLSRIRTVVVAVITSNLNLADAPGNVSCRRKDTRLPRDSVVNLSQLITLDKGLLTERVSSLNPTIIRQVEAGLRLVLAL